MTVVPLTRTTHVDLPPLDDDRWGRLLDDVVRPAQGVALIDDRTVVIDLVRDDASGQGTQTEPSGRRSSASS